MGNPSDFDALDAWLAIPKSQRPPTHYALLGVPLFETNQELIAAAYHRRYQLIRKYEVGPREEAAVRLLDELSRAFRTLSNPDLKPVYDQALEASVTLVAAGSDAHVAAAVSQPPSVPAAATNRPVQDVLETSCPNATCRAPFQLRREWAGAIAHCKTCNSQISIGADLTPTLILGATLAEIEEEIVEATIAEIEAEIMDCVVDASLTQPPVVLATTDIRMLQKSRVVFCPNQKCRAPIQVKMSWAGTFAQCTTCRSPLAIGDDLSVTLAAGKTTLSTGSTSEKGVPSWLPSVSRQDVEASLWPEEDLPPRLPDCTVESPPDVQVVNAKIETSRVSPAATDAVAAGKVAQEIVETSCPNPRCKARFLLRRDWAGELANCKTCNARIVIGKDLIPRLFSETPTLLETNTETEIC